MWSFVSPANAHAGKKQVQPQRRRRRRQILPLKTIGLPQWYLRKSSTVRYKSTNLIKEKKEENLLQISNFFLSWSRRIRRTFIHLAEKKPETVFTNSGPFWHLLEEINIYPQFVTHHLTLFAFSLKQTMSIILASVVLLCKMAHGTRSCLRPSRLL